MYINSINDPQWLCQRYLNLVYSEARNRFDQQQDIAQTYGEILFKSMSKLLAAAPLNAQDSFLDLGSGLGKVILQVFLQSPVREAYGVEIIPGLHEQAMAAGQRMQQDLPHFFAGERKLSFIQGDFLQLPWPRATTVLIGSPCFGPSILNKLGERINADSAIHTVLSLRPLGTLQRLPFRKALRVECSWDSAQCLLYRRDTT